MFSCPSLSLRVRQGLLTIATVFCLVWPVAEMAGAEAGPGLESLRHVRELVRQTQLGDGAIRMQASGTNVRIVPYFSNLAATGLLMANQVDPEPADIDRVRDWILWYAANQEADGTIFDFTGTVEAYTKSDQRDSTDSYAATFLQVLWRFSEAAGAAAVTPEMVDAGRGALDAIELTFDPADGLTWAMPEYRVKFLMDNLEVRMGLEEGALFFDAVGEVGEAARARGVHAAVVDGLAEFWLPEAGYYAWAKGSSGALHEGFELWYPDALVNLFALAHADPVRPGLWGALTESFGDDPDLTPEWWVFPALRVGTDGERRGHVVATMDFSQSMTAQSHQVNRFGRTLLALAESEDVWRGLETIAIAASLLDRVILDNDGDGSGDQLGAVSQPTASVGEPFTDSRQARYYLPFELTEAERERLAGEQVESDVFLRLRLDGINAVDGLVAQVFGYNGRSLLSASAQDYQDPDATLLYPAAIPETAVSGRWVRFDVTEFAQTQAGQGNLLLAFRLQVDPPDALPNGDGKTNFFRVNSADSDFAPHLEVVPRAIIDPDPDPIDCVEPGPTHAFDVVVYGGTASGVMAAVAAAREGASVALLEPFHNLGGMVSGGLSATDHGRVSTIGGLTLEFFERLGAHYGQSGATWRHEPHVAEQVFAEMAAEAGVTVFFGHRLKQVCGVFKSDGSITAIALENAAVFAADVFIDATYEGDLMAGAKVPYRVGREGQEEYSEAKAGIRSLFSIDPSFSPYDDEGGLLPTLVEDEYGEEGAGDGKIQAYNYRLTLTRDPANRLPLTAPANYDRRLYSLMAQSLATSTGVVRLDQVLSLVALPNGKFDANHRAWFSLDLPNFSWEYPEANYARREEIRQFHEDFIRGMLYFLAHDPDVREELRQDTLTYGLAADEFVENGNWPHQLYVRQARRMVGSYVMVQQDLQENITKPDSIGMGSYYMDVHWVRAILMPDGRMGLEGKLGSGNLTRPYEIPYRSIVPRAEDCGNLLVSVANSASHVAYSSIRMEPVYMILGHSAGTTAALAAQGGDTVQAVDPAALRAVLLDDGQVLAFDDGGVAYHEVPGVIVDHPEAEVTGGWRESNSAGPFVGFTYLHDGDTDKGALDVRYVPEIPRSGTYEVAISYSPFGNRARNVPVTVHHAEGSTTVRVDQRQAMPDGQPFFALGSFPFEAGTSGSVVISNAGTDGYVIADAVQFSSSYAGWAGDWFTAAELADPAVSGPGADPSGRGAPNLLAYALGFPPGEVPPGALPQAAFGEIGGVERVSVSFFQSRLPRDVTLAVESSADLQVWSGDGVVLERGWDGGAFEHVEAWEAFDDLPGKRFYRLKVNE